MVIVTPDPVRYSIHPVIHISFISINPFQCSDISICPSASSLSLSPSRTIPHVPLQFVVPTPKSENHASTTSEGNPRHPYINKGKEREKRRNHVNLHPLQKTKYRPSSSNRPRTVVLPSSRNQTPSYLPPRYRPFCYLDILTSPPKRLDFALALGTPCTTSTRLSLSTPTS